MDNDNDKNDNDKYDKYDKYDNGTDSGIIIIIMNSTIEFKKVHIETIMMISTPLVSTLNQ